MYEHIVYDGFEFATSAQVEPALKRAHADRKRRVEGLCDDRLADRLRRRARSRSSRRWRRSSRRSTTTRRRSRSGRGGRGAHRAAGFHPEERQDLRQRRDLVVSMVNQAKGLTCPRPEGASTSIRRARGRSGKTTAAGARIGTTRISSAPSEKRGWRWCRLAFGLAPFPHLLRHLDRGAGRRLQPHSAGVCRVEVRKCCRAQEARPTSIKW